MWHAGRARKYENQSTGISNFQFEYFLDEERVWIPALPVQDRILGLIGTLDDKIDSNVRVNRTLDAFAQALMQQLVARPHAATEHTAPNATLGDALSVLETGSRPSGGVKGITSGIPSIGAESIVGAGIFDFSKVKFIPQDFYAGLKRGSIEDRDVLLYKDGGRPGNFEPHVSIVGEGFPFRYAAINEHVYRLRVRSPYSQDFLYLWLRSDWLADEMRRRGTGVAVPGLNSTAVKALPLITPDLENLAQMQDAVAPLLTLILSNANESRRLSELRDALLARTVSGRMLVPDTGDPQEVVGSMVEQALS
jgi:type I restriction enzyme S subunit